MIHFPKTNLFSCRSLTVGLLVLSLMDLCRADAAEFHRTLSVSNAEPVMLAIDISKGDIDIAYSRDGEVTITASAQSSDQNKIDETYFQIALGVTQVRNRISIQQTPNFIIPDDNLKLRYRIEVPYRTEITSSVKHGKQTVRGVTGPVDLKGNGDVSVAYVSATVTVELERGNLDCQMIGDRVVARSSTGNISAERLPKGIHAETGDGDIKLMVIGPSEAKVHAGSGRIEVGGARDTLSAATDSGDIRVQAVPHADWNLNSNSGSIRLELPPRAAFDLQASSATGKLQFDRDDLPAVSPNARTLAQKVNGGGRKVAASTKSGAIWIR